MKQELKHAIFVRRQHSDRVTCIVVDIVASRLMSGSADGTVWLCDFTDGQKICCLLPSSPPTGFFFSSYLVHFSCLSVNVCKTINFPLLERGPLHIVFNIMSFCRGVALARCIWGQWSAAPPPPMVAFPAKFRSS